MTSFRNCKAFSTPLAIAIIVIVVVAAIAIAGVYIVYSSGSPKTQKMNFSDFTAVDVGSAFKVSITQSNTYSVIITANERIFGRIEVTQTGNTLKIDIQPGIFFGISNAVAQITMPKLDNVVLSGATHGTAAGFSSTEPFAADISGAKFTRND